MLQSIVDFSIRFRGLVLTSACALAIYGLLWTTRAKLDVFPEFVQPQVMVQTEAPGLAPEQVETLVTLPVETAIQGLGSMEALRSESIQGLSIITAVFKESTDVMVARQMLAEKLGELTGKLPVGVQAPRMTPLTSSTMDLLKIGLVSDRSTPMQLRAFADWTLKPRLLSVPGVAKCSVFGGDVRQIQIQLNPDRLAAYGLSLGEVIQAAKLSTGVAGAGFVETSNQRLAIQTEGQSLSASALGEILISGTTNGVGVRLKDLGTVVEGVEPKYGETLIQGRPGVLLTMSSQYGANTMEVTRSLEAALEELKPMLVAEGITLYPRLHRPATFIESALSNIQHSLWLGGCLVAVVLFLFLGNVRVAFIALTAIPLSLLAAMIGLERWGVTLNTMTLGGLAIAIGEVVDDAIIDVENIFRRLRLNSRLPQPLPAYRVVLEASLEVRTAVVYATFIVALVFVPVLTMTGIQGSFFSPLALSYILAILASLGVALTVTPALSMVLLARYRPSEREPVVQRGLQALYEKLLRPILRSPRVVMVIVALVCLSAIWQWPRGNGEFLPEFRERHFVVQVSTAPGTSLPEMLRVGSQISKAMLADPRIATVEQQVGRAELGEDPWGPHRSEFHVDLKPVSEQEERALADDLRTLLSGFPGIQFEVMTFLKDRIGESIAGETSAVVIHLFGNTFDILDEKAQQAVEVLRKVPGAADVQIKSPPGAPRIAVQLKSDRLRQYGLRPVEVLDAIQTVYRGTPVAQTFEGNRVTDVVVMLEPEMRRRPESVAQLMIHNSMGLRIPLREVADVYETSGRHSILHDGGRRLQTITCNPTGRDVSSFVSEARERLAREVTLPRGVYWTFAGAAEAAARARQQLWIHCALAGVGILMLLSVVFRNLRNLSLILMNLPFAFVGGLLSLLIARLIQGEDAGGVSIGSLVGFVTLFGITTRNSMMLLSHYEHLVSVEGCGWNLETALRGARERLLPISMTALVTGLGLLPLAMGSGAAGREIEGPMAIVILGGLLTSTLLNLSVLPSLALKYGRFGAVESDDLP